MKVKTIPARPVFTLPKPRRVAAYCRVSTKQEIQYHSLEAQREYYGKYIDSKSFCPQKKATLPYYARHYVLSRIVCQDYTH